MKKNINITLMISPTMTGNAEHDVVRFPLHARDKLGLSVSTKDEWISLGDPGSELEVKVRPALMGDVRQLHRQMRTGEIDLDETRVVGFVSQKTYRMLTKNPEAVLKAAKPEGKITVGADPEFGFVRPDGLLQFAEHVLPDSKKSKFGADGPGVEVRPEPNRDHLKVVDSIFRILNKPPAAAKEYKWIGGATYRDPKRAYWFGGHIHLGRPKGLPDHLAPYAFSGLAKVLDHFLALPMLSFDTPEPFLRRDGCPGHHYGRASDIREKDNYSRFEYRTLSGVWLTHPTLAKIVIGATKAVAEDFYQRAAKAGHSSDFYTGPRPGFYHGADSYKLTKLNETVALINRAQLQGLTTERFDYWVKLLESLGNREEYAAEIEALMQLVKNAPDNVVPALTLDIRKNWQEEEPFLPDAPNDLKTALDAVEKKS